MPRKFSVSAFCRKMSLSRDTPRPYGDFIAQRLRQSKLSLALAKETQDPGTIKQTQEDNDEDLSALMVDLGGALDDKDADLKAANARIEELERMPREQRPQDFTQSQKVFLGGVVTETETKDADLKAAYLQIEDLKSQLEQARRHPPARKLPSSQSMRYRAEERPPWSVELHNKLSAAEEEIKALRTANERLQRSFAPWLELVNDVQEQTSRETKHGAKMGTIRKTIDIQVTFELNSEDFRIIGWQPDRSTVAPFANLGEDANPGIDDDIVFPHGRLWRDPPLDGSKEDDRSTPIVYPSPTVLAPYLREFHEHSHPSLRHIASVQSILLPRPTPPPPGSDSGSDDSGSD